MTVARTATSISFTVTGTTVVVSQFSQLPCTVVANTATCNVPATTFVYVSGGDGDDTLIGTPDHDDWLDGSLGNDTIYGNGGDDGRITGNGTQNFGGLDGNEGNDTIFGGAGDDLINGGPGLDHGTARPATTPSTAATASTWSTAAMVTTTSTRWTRCISRSRPTATR